MRPPLTQRGVMLVLGAGIAACATLHAEGLNVSGRITLVPAASRAKASNNSNAVVWLTPLEEVRTSMDSNQRGFGSRRFRLVQKNKQFSPHLLVVPAGAVVEFPNQDPIFHNVFSLFDGRRFDLGLYEAGSTRTVTFREPGVSYIFCNIHPEMSAVVIALATPYYSISDAAGEFSIANVPAGRYQLNVWHERALPDALKALSRPIVVSPGATALGELRLPETGDLLSKHKNKYGRDYDSSRPGSDVYDQP